MKPPFRFATTVLFVSLGGCVRPEAPLRTPLSDAEYLNKVRGEWLGKVVGGALGMPLEGWNSEDIAGAFGTANDYVDGYFTERRVGSSQLAQEQAIPTDGKWRPYWALLAVPRHDTRKAHAAPVLRLANRSGAATLECEFRKLNLGGGVIHDWNEVLRGWYFHKTSVLGRKAPEPGVAALSLPPRQSDELRLLPRQTKTLRLSVGAKLEIAIEGRCNAGEPWIGFSFDYLANDTASGFKPDDDTTYQVIGLVSLEKYGPDLSAKQIGKSWAELAPQEVDLMVAEGVALQRVRSGIEPPKSGEHDIGEAIGGQMRGEIWGLVAPGRPDLAAEYARRDGVVAHHTNGVYGEQFVAAMMAAAFYDKDVPTLVQTGLKNVPADSKYAQVVRFATDLYKKYPDYRDALRELKRQYEPLSYVDVCVDAGIVTMALLYGDGDFEKTILIAANSGNDTDCNAATVGALIGCIRGANTLPAKWIKPIGDDFRCGVKGYEAWKITDLATRICAAGKRVRQHHGREIKFTTAL